MKNLQGVLQVHYLQNQYIRSMRIPMAHQQFFFLQKECYYQSIFTAVIYWEKQSWSHQTKVGQQPWTWRNRKTEMSHFSSEALMDKESKK